MTADSTQSPLSRRFPLKSNTFCSISNFDGGDNDQFLSSASSKIIFIFRNRYKWAYSLALIDFFGKEIIVQCLSTEIMQISGVSGLLEKFANVQGQELDF